MNKNKNYTKSKYHAVDLMIFRPTVLISFNIKMIKVAEPTYMYILFKLKFRGKHFPKSMDIKIALYT